MSEPYSPKTLMGFVFGIWGIHIGMALGVIRGAIDRICGRSFLEGLFETTGCVYRLAGEFGDKHGGKIVSRVISGLLLGAFLNFPVDFQNRD